MLRNKVRSLEKRIEYNELLYLECVVIKTDAEEKEAKFSSKIENLQSQLDVANKSISALRSRYNSCAEELEKKKIDLDQSRHKRKRSIDSGRRMQKKLYYLTTKLEEDETSSSGMSPSFVRKLKKFKANYNVLKAENKLLKQQLIRECFQAILVSSYFFFMR